MKQTQLISLSDNLINNLLSICLKPGNKFYFIPVLFQTLNKDKNIVHVIKFTIMETNKMHSISYKLL